MITSTGRHITATVTEDGRTVFGAVSEVGIYCESESAVGTVVTTTATAAVLFVFTSGNIVSSHSVAAASCYLHLLYADALQLPLACYVRVLISAETTKRFTMTEV